MDTIEDIARRVADGHAFDIHVVARQEFKDEHYGPSISIETRAEFAQHVADILGSTETLCFTAHTTAHQERQADIFYHPASNTLIVVPGNEGYEATAFRPKAGFEAFTEKVRLSQRFEERYDIQVVNSIYELRPELAAAREALRIKEEDAKLREAIEKRFIEERNKKLAQHERELKHSADPEAARSRHAGELRFLEAQKEKDFERYKREREDARRLQERGKERERTEQKQKDGPVLGRGRIR